MGHLTQYLRMISLIGKIYPNIKVHNPNQINSISATTWPEATYKTQTKITHTLNKKTNTPQTQTTKTLIAASILPKHQSSIISAINSLQSHQNIGEGCANRQKLNVWVHLLWNLIKFLNRFIYLLIQFSCWFICADCTNLMDISSISNSK